jgi:hypothetical protein
LNNKIISSTKTNTLFLAVILVAGTFAAITPSSSFINGVEAQSETEYAYNSYAPIPEYQDNNDYNKLKDSVSIEKIKCNNININFLGNNTGDITLGNKGQTPTEEEEEEEEEEGYLGAYSSDDGYDGERYYDDGYNNNKDIRFECIINNNNNNTVVEEEPPVEDECPEADEVESCFRQFLLDFLFPNFVDALESGITVEINGQEVTLKSFEDICEALEGITTFAQLQSALVDILAAAGITDILITPLAACIAEVLGIPVSHG